MYQKVRVEIDDEAVSLLSKMVSDLDVERPIVWISEQPTRQGDVTRGANGEAVWQIEDFPLAWEISLEVARTEWPESYFQRVKGFEVMAPFARFGVVAVRVTVVARALHVDSVP